MTNTDSKLDKLQVYLKHLKKVTVAVSGGVDSMTLAYVSHQTLGSKAKIIHSISAAVPTCDTARIREFADTYNWNIQFVDSGEINHPEYKTNPVNRCYFCKTCLYTKLSSFNHGTVVSGTNLDDLDDYRPGLIAAKEHNVLHPYVEVGINKQTIREMALRLGLPQLSVLPASPCLASRIETGISVNEESLNLIQDIETRLNELLHCDSLRCRVQSGKITIEINRTQLSSLSSKKITILKIEVEKITQQYQLNIPITFTPYKRGSAFIGAK